MTPTDTRAREGRLVSIDAFRGFDMVMIMGLASVLIALGKCIYGEGGGWLAAQMTHPQWFGLTFYDMIFPTFLFISGMTFPCGSSPERPICTRDFRKTAAASLTAGCPMHFLTP